VHRLTGADAGFLAMELPNQPTHHVSLLLLGPREPSASPAPVTLDDLRSYVAAHLDELPALRWRVKRVPLGWHHPVAFDDPTFDLDAHLSSVTLRAPGGPEELDRLVASLAEHCLDRSRPLWHMTLVDGMDDGRQAIAVQMHHCLMDGNALTNAYARIFSEEAGASSEEGTPESDAATARRADREPGAVRLLAGALRDHIKATLRLPKLIRRSLRGGAALKARVAASPMQLPVAGVDTPACSLNVAAGPGRHFARTVLPLPEVRLVKEAAGTTVNDVAMALCAGALRSYLQERNGLPGKPLIACVPVGLRPTGSAPRTSGNQWAIMTTPLATDVADPWDRLESIAAAAQETKTRLDLVGRELLRDWTEYLHPWVAEPAAKRQQARLASGKERVACNVTVSNLRGPAVPWSIAGAVVEELYFTGPPTNRLGVVFVLADQGQSLSFGILSVAGSVDDPGALAAGLHTSLRELVKAAEERRAAEPAAATAKA